MLIAYWFSLQIIGVIKLLGSLRGDYSARECNPRVYLTYKSYTEILITYCLISVTATAIFFFIMNV
jgi:hypothetical protein